MTEGLYTVLEQRPDELHLRLSSENHPLFQAHFPGNPIVPGFALIDIVANVLEDTPVSIKLSKFIAHLLPNDTIVCKVKRDGKKKHISIFRDTKKVSEIIYESK